MNKTDRKRMPGVLTNAAVDLEYFERRYSVGDSPRDRFFAEIVDIMAAQVPRGSDNWYNRHAVFVAAAALMLLPEPIDPGTLTYRESMMLYYAAEYSVGRRWQDHFDFIGAGDVSVEVAAELMQPGEPNSVAATHWRPGMAGRPPAGAKEAWARRQQELRASR